MSFNLDSKAILVDKLATDKEKFWLSNVILPKKRSLNAIKELYSLENDLLKFAHNPEATPYLPEKPEEPDLTELTDEQKQEKLEAYEALKEYWDLLREAHELKISTKDYMHIQKFIGKFKMVIDATSAVKGLRFKAFTKNPEQQEKKGLLGALGGGEKD